MPHSQLTDGTDDKTNLEYERRGNFENLWVFWEVGLSWSDTEKRRSFSGRIDWGIGFPIGEETSLSTTIHHS